ncbi:MAG: GNAT family N-acetyltransferase [Oscillospiraceae bacterium]|nr:GNAT family N-acetyltransferase [Oscillospiraceae bacterium]
MNIRIMTIRDYESVYAIWAGTPGMGLNTLDDSIEGIGKYLTRNPNSCFVAEIDGGVAGVILSGHDGRRGMIHHLAVQSCAQRQGIGSALVDAAMTALKNEGITKVLLTVLKTNTQGSTFWEKLEFTPRPDLEYRNKELVDMSNHYITHSL